MTKVGEKVVVKYTYEDLLSFPPDGKRYEIIDGDLFVTPAPAPGHQRVLFRLTLIVGSHVEKQDLGELFFAPLDVVFKPDTVCEPDMLFGSKSRLSIITDKNIHGAPDLVVEILSRSTERTDRTRKLDAYAENGVAHYWIIDPRTKTLEEHRLADGAYELAARLEGNATFKPAIFPRLKIALRELWRR